MKTTRLLAPVMLSMALAACGGGGDDDGGGTPSSTSMLVTAAAGGEVTLEDGAGVNIPAGALAADTTITIESTAPSGLPDADTLTGLAYDFGPDGTTFSAPVTLTLPVSGTPGDGETAVVSWLDESDNTWQDLTTTVSGGMASAETTHFTTFIIRFKPDSLGGECSFAACGGDPVGTWTLDSACLQDGANPFEDTCADAIIEIDLSGSTGTLAINADMTYSTNFTFTGTFTFTLPMSCTDDIGITSCTDLNDPEEGRTCVDASGGGCTCTATITDDDPSAETGTYTRSGNTFTTVPTDDPSGGDTVEYCVDGNVLKASIVTAEGQQILTFTK